MAELSDKEKQNQGGGPSYVQEDKTRLFRRVEALKTERASWFPTYQDLSRFIQPGFGRFFVNDRNLGTSHDYSSIIDDTATEALDILAAGLMSGLTSPARPWFRLGVRDDDLADDATVRDYLATCQRIMLDVFAHSNTYAALHNVYYELGLFGTACNLIMDDYDTVIHNYSITVGEFCIAADFKGKVNTLTREFQKTVAELVGEFGYANCSEGVQNLWNSRTYDAWINVYHVIEPRKERDATKLDGKNMAWRSVYFEVQGPKDKFLRDSGFNEFRVLAPRWHRTGGDIYGRGPGIRALGAVKQLQHEQLRKANAIDQMTKPSLQAPTSLKSTVIDMLPGGLTLVDSPGGQSAVRNLMDVRVDLNHLGLDMQEVRQRIRGAFYSDLFLMISESNDAQKTVSEIAERHEEKMMVLGPVLERLQSELLNPLIDTTFTRCLNVGIFPPAPEVLHGRPIDVEYVSVLAQAQKAINTNGVDRFVGNLMQISTVVPAILDKFNSDKWADKYSDMLGVDPDLVNDDDAVAGIRQARAKTQAQQAAAEQANMASQTAKNLGQTPTTGGNAVSDILNQVSGYGSPSPTEL